MDDKVSELPFWDSLTDSEKSACKSGAVCRKYETGSYLLGNCGNNGCLGMIHIISGEIRAFILSDEGREITLFRVGAGGNCVLSATCVLSQITFETQIQITQDAEILIIPSSTYGMLMDENIYVRCFTYELATERFSQVMWVMQEILFSGFDKRLANFFLAEYKKNGIPRIRMTQEEIAVSTNSAREVVARMIKRFSAEGLIESKRGITVLKDIPGLEAVIKGHM